MPHQHEPGTPVLFGTACRQGGVQFTIFSRHATRVWLMLLDHPRAEAGETIELDPRRNRLGDLWHVFVHDVGPGQLYVWLMDGPRDPRGAGHRFDPEAWLIDPYAKAITGAETWGDEFPGKAVGVVIDDTFEWRNDQHPRRSLRDSVIYECHVRGFTRHPNSQVTTPGTFRGIIEKIPYLVDLGVTAVELLPVQEFDELENPRVNPLTGERLFNYWGYSTIGFFAPMGRFGGTGTLGEQVREFKQMVQAFHRVGIEVILDVVFNHTAEGDQRGPTYNFRGMDNSIFYLLEDNGVDYRNYSGCGNTLNCNHPVVREMIRNALRYWVLVMHVDGFRFDLASILGRDQEGNLMPNPPLLESIVEDPVLRDTKIIAEAWDAAGAYQVGSFPGGRFAEWNGRYRDDVRRFWAGHEGSLGPLATRLAGSEDLYRSSGRLPYHSINFITAHDGFTLHDLVSYEQKHNEANGEDNRDGHNDNIAQNGGVEGPTDDPAINRWRTRQVKNFAATLMLSQGVPMLLMGDEGQRTQQGNNNAYCHDSELTWLDWERLEANAETYRFVRGLITIRHTHPVFRRRRFFEGRDQSDNECVDIQWLSPDGGPADWSPHARTLMVLIDGHALEIEATRDDNHVLLLVNGAPDPVEFMLPTCPGEGKWQRFMDTGLASPDDLHPHGDRPEVEGGTYRLTDRAVAGFFSQKP